MKPQIGTVKFNYLTEDDKDLQIEASVFFNKQGEPSLHFVEILNESLKYNNLSDNDKRDIEFYALTKCDSQEEVYEEREEI